MRALVWLLAMGLLVAMLVFRPQIVGTGSDLAPAAAAPAFYAAWVCDFGSPCHLDIAFR
jgi:hypothetical protein